MQRERVADDIYVFTSDLYAQVTAGAIITTEGAVLIDTLLFPEESRQIKQYVEGRLGCPIRYVIQTHYHADHTYGTHLFPEATVIAHAECFRLQETRGREGLTQAQAEMAELRSVKLVMPQLVFERRMFSLRCGNKTLQLWHTPGHSLDSVVCLVREDRILFAGDTIMPLPFFVDGDLATLSTSLQSLQDNTFECIIQGHGDVVLRGEIEAKLASDLKYLATVRKYALAARHKSDPLAYLARVDIERCGKSRVSLGGLANQLHQQNIHMLYRQLVTAEEAAEAAEAEEEVCFEAGED